LKRKEGPLKNVKECNEKHGERRGTHCYYYEKIQQICIKVDKNTVEDPWEFAGFCGARYGQKVEDSSKSN